MKKFALILITCLYTVLTGCSIATAIKENDVAATIAIKYATLKVIEQADSPTATAKEIVRVVTEAKSFIDEGEVAIIAELEAKVRDSIDFDSMALSDVMLVDTLLNAVKAELESRMTGGAIDPENVMYVMAVLDNVESAAGIYI